MEIKPTNPAVIKKVEDGCEVKAVTEVTVKLEETWSLFLQFLFDWLVLHK